jgi:hypothetical protein
VFELICQKKYAWVFINKERVFQAVKRVHHIETLLDCMSTSARTKADAKMGLNQKLIELQSRERQYALLAERENIRAASA